MSSSSSTETSSAPSIHHMMDRAKHIVADTLISCAKQAYASLPSPADVDLSDSRAEIIRLLTKPSKSDNGDLTLPVFTLVKKLGKVTPGGKPQDIAALLHKHLQANLPAQISQVNQEGGYLNFFVSTSFLASVIPLILSGEYISPLPKQHEQVMIEYSQPNSHKAFHVGHMRNVALGDCLIRLYEHMGYPVIAANYFGDEGAHVAKCLWYLKLYLTENPSFDLDSVPVPERGEWLGKMYAAAVEALSLDTYTLLPCPGVICARVLSKEKHSHEKAPSNWNIVRVDIGSGEPVTVVCGGIGYEVGDYVPYVPVGGKIKKKEGKGDIVVEPRDMLGVISNGVILSTRELDLDQETHPEQDAAQNQASIPSHAVAASSSSSQTTPSNVKPKPKAADSKPEKSASAASKPAKGDKKEKDNKKEKEALANDTIFVLNKASLPQELVPGKSLVECGRKPGINVPADKLVLDVLDERKKQSKELLQAMEKGEKEICALWDKTKQWSLDEFKRIYAWVGARFDVDFYESQVSEPSLKMVKQWAAEGKLKNDRGAIGCDLSEYGLGFCMLLKSNGSGLYATKDMALATRKFEEFHVDKSLYIVDAAQTLHFKQVFKTLELMGYPQASKCVHLPYGQVVLQSGKMSSRTGTVIFFSQLKQLLNEVIYTNFLQQYSGDVNNSASSNKKSDIWSREEIEEAQQKIAVATIRYGMLNHDTAKDIVFVLDEWTQTQGNTGPYMLYAYARIRSIIRSVSVDPNAKVDYSLLTNPFERNILLVLHEMWNVLESVTQKNNPSGLCDWLFELAKSFSSFYENVNIMKESDENVKATRMAFINAVASVLKQGLNLLGIQTLERM